MSQICSRVQLWEAACTSSQSLQCVAQNIVIPNLAQPAHPRIDNVAHAKHDSQARFSGGNARVIEEL